MNPLKRLGMRRASVLFPWRLGPLTRTEAGERCCEGGRGG